MLISILLSRIIPDKNDVETDENKFDDKSAIENNDVEKQFRDYNIPLFLLNKSFGKTLYLCALLKLLIGLFDA